MRITVDISPAVHHRAGIGRYAQELLTALVLLDHENEYRTFYNAQRTERPDPPLDCLQSRLVRSGDKVWRSGVALATLGGVGLDRYFPPCDVFHATDYVLPPLRRAASVLTVYDLTFLTFKEYHLPMNRLFLRFMLPRFLQMSDAVIAISEATRKDLMRLMATPSEKIKVIHLGVSKTFRPVSDPTQLATVRQKYHLPGQFILALGTIEPRKNLVRVLDAYRSLLARKVEVPDLVIAGRRGWLHEAVFDRWREWGLETRVHFSEWIDENDLPYVLSAATLLVYPALSEGFGLPPLEAMACGVPVISSNAASLPEVVGDAGIQVDPLDIGAIAEAIERVTSDTGLRADLRQRGISRARQFSWESTARRTLAVYEQAAGIRNAHRN